MRISAKGVLYIEGPAAVEKLSGTLVVAGAEFERVLVPKHKGTALRLPEESELEVTLFQGGRIVGTELERPRPKERDELAETISDRERVMLVGPVDSGKSFLAVFLANRLGASRILDTDTGQGIISPPATIGLARYSRVPFLSYLSAERMYFVGSTSPAEFMPIFLSGVLKLARFADSRTIIDTTGRVTDKGARLKVAKAEMLDAKVVLIERTDLSHIAAALKASGIEFVRVPPLSVVTERPKEARREIRSSLYAKRLAKTADVKVPRDRVYGRPFPGAARASEDAILERDSAAIVPELTAEKPEKRIVPAEDLVGLLVGLEREGLAVGIGFIKSVERDGILVSAGSEDFEYVRLGIVKIDVDTLEEVGRRTP